MKNFNFAAVSITSLILVLTATQTLATFIDFDDGVDLSSVGSFYSGKGVTFSNAEFNDLGTLDGGTPPLAIAGENGNYFMKSDNPVVATFSSGQTYVSIMVLDLGENGVRIDAYDAAIGGNLIDFQEAFGPDIGVGNYEIISVSYASESIMRIELYQLLDISGDGIVFDNLTFVPEPATLSLLGLGGLALMRKRK